MRFLEESLAFNVDLTTVPRPSNEDPRSGTIVAGRFRVMERLGKGGMASVYRAIDRENGTDYAVKFLDRRYASDPEMARRCQREAKTMAALTHHHIPRSYVVGSTETGDLYIVMEFLRGRDLEQVVRSEGPMLWSRALTIGLQICDALVAVHAQNIIHRDVKPSNCFLVEAPGLDFAKLIDFGIVRDLDASGDQTGTGLILGTAGYVAPELLAGTTRASPLTDVYALGVTLFKLMTGKLPWAGSTPLDVAHDQQHGTPRSMNSALLGGTRVPTLVERTIMRALEREPERRYASAGAFSEALAEALAEAPRESTVIPSWLRRVRPPSRGGEKTQPLGPSRSRARNLAWTPVALASIAVMMWSPARARISGAVDLPPPASVVEQNLPLPPVPAATRTASAASAPVFVAPRPAPRPKVVASVRSPRDKAVKRELKSQLPYLRTTCAAHEKEREVHTVQIELSKGGSVTRVGPAGSPLARCIERLIATVKFPVGGAAESISFTFYTVPPLL